MRSIASPPRSPGRSAAQPPGGEVQICYAIERFTSPLAGEVGGAAAGWGGSDLLRRINGNLGRLDRDPHLGTRVEMQLADR